MVNQYISEILIISAFHTIFCFDSTTYQSLAITWQRRSPLHYDVQFVRTLGNTGYGNESTLHHPLLQYHTVSKAHRATNIESEVNLLDPNMLRRAILDVRARCFKCIAANGGHFE